MLREGGILHCYFVLIWLLAMKTGQEGPEDSPKVQGPARSWHTKDEVVRCCRSFRYPRRARVPVDGANVGIDPALLLDRLRREISLAQRDSLQGTRPLRNRPVPSSLWDWSSERVRFARISACSALSPSKTRCSHDGEAIVR